MNTTAEVYLWGTRIGIIHQELNIPYASFEYDERFRNSRIEISPLTMPLSGVVYEFPMLAGEPFYGLPGLVSDSLPDNFGNRVIEQWLASQNRSVSEFTAIDRLCYTGKRGMGALEYVPANPDTADIDAEINVNRMVQFASDVLTNRASVILDADEALSYSQFIQVGSSAGGARAKALIAWNEKTNEVRSGQLLLNKDFDYWLMKFDNVARNGDHGLEDEPEYTLIEYIYYLMAKDAGIDMQECRIYTNGSENHFMTKRFDRVNGKKIHMQSLGALAHISYKTPGLCSYEMAAQYMQKMQLPMKEIEQFYTRMVFNCIAVNQDDHVKNISFLMNRNGEWHLSPAYDITFAYNPQNRWLRVHQMTVNGKDSHIHLDDMLQSGIRMGLKERKCREIISRVSETVAHFESFASQVGIRNRTVSMIRGILDMKRDEL